MILMLRWILENIPRWTLLQRLRGRQLEWISKFAVIACPIIGIIFNYLEAIKVFPESDISAIRRFVPLEFVVAYIVALPYALATIIFDLVCPEDIKLFKSSQLYLAKFGSINSTQDEMKEALRTTMRATFSGLSEDKINERIGTIVSEVVEDTSSAEGIWRMQNSSRTFARAIVFGLYALSIALSIVVFGWTAPRHVFHVSSLLDAFRYLLGD